MRYNYKKMSEGKIFVILLIIVFGAAFGFRACATSVAQGNQHTEIVTVCGKESVQKGRDGHEYRVYTSGQTYTVEDYYGSQGSRFDSADLYGRIKVGETYIIKSYGYRVPWASTFWNIQSVTPTTQRPTGPCG